ncbi:hypothetical protein AHAS_Ahas19G0222200 [Arachis hypogaea]
MPRAAISIFLTRRATCQRQPINANCYSATLSLSLYMDSHSPSSVIIIVGAGVSSVYL